MATVDKNFRIKNGLVVEGSTATVNGNDILTKDAGDSYIINLIGGTATSANTPSTVVKRDANGNFVAGTITANIVGDVTGTVSSISNHDTGDLAEGSNLYFTNARALSATAAAYDAAGSAATAQANAATDATTKVAAEATARTSAIASAIATEVADRNTAIATAKAAAEAVAASDATTKANAAQTAAAADATTKANAAQAAAEATAAAALSTAISTEVSARNTAIGNAVDSLVDGAPALLNTLNELAAAINDDANYTTTITTALGTKANSTDVTASLATAASNAAADATAKANAAQAAAEATAAADATAKVSAEAALRVSGDSASVATAAADATTKANAAQAAAEATAQSALNAVKDGTTKFTAVNVNDVAVVKAATTTVSSAGTVNALTWAAADYRTAKGLVKFKNGAHTQVSEILLTLDTSNNVAITEFGSIGTNGDLGSISAAYVSGNVSISVTTVYASTDVMVYATLIK
jgi:hypothetical protein